MFQKIPGMRMRVLLTAVFFVALVHGAAAQTITTGVLEGVVVDQNGLPLADVLVQLTPLDGGASRSGLSNREGVFQFALLPAGRYQISFERLGYRPVIVEGVRLSANSRVPLSIRLTEAPPPVEAAERIQLGAAAAGSRAGASQLLSPFAVDEIPWELRELGELPRLASSATRAFEVEGLPARFNATRIDGVQFTPAHNPAVGFERSVVLPLNSIATAELVMGDADAEWGEAAGGTLSTTTRRGGNAFSARSFGSWSGNALRSSDLFDTGELSGNSIWGGVLLSGAIIQDTAQVAVGLEFSKLARPHPSVWSLDENTTAALLGAGTGRGEDLTDYTLPHSVESTAITGFGRFDWQLAANNQLSVRAAFGSVQPGSNGFDMVAAAAPYAVADARDVLLSAALTSLIGSNWAHELRLGFSNSTREYRDEDGALLPATTIVSGAQIGVVPGLLGDFSRSELSADQSLQIPVNNHQVKLGLGVGFGLHDHNYPSNAVGHFSFGGATQLAQAQGLFVQTSAAEPEVSFSTLRVRGFIQDSWVASPGVQLTAGVRFDFESLPADDINPDSGWLAASGLDNTAFDDRPLNISPRFALTWDVGSRGQVLVRFNAGRYASAVDPAVIAELLAGDGDLSVRRTFGDLNAWPATPAAGASSVVGTRLAILGPDFRGPQSDRFSLGVSSQLGNIGTLQLSAAYRKTGFLPRRSDLNLVANASGQDQYGRSVFGTLSQSGELLTAVASNRRFSGYDVVSGINADGSSEYAGFTIGLERDAGTARFFGSYTYSQTTDDWSARGQRPEAGLAPFPGATSDAWLDGTSDYDLPHRAVAGFEFAPQVAMSPRFTAIYRFQSGYPFTPGFRDGVDANGDGSDSNDPAFVDTNIAGISELTADWDCLSGQSGQFAERNSCRGDNTHELDLRLGLNLLNSAGTTAQLFVEGINLMDARFDQPDRALVLVDASRTIQVNGGNINVPLIANPNFGKPLLQRGSGRLLRIGIQVNH